MKKWIHFFAITLFLAPNVWAQTVLLTESFTYSPGDLTATSGNVWVNHSGTGNFLQSVADQLSFPGYSLSGSKSVSFAGGSGSREDANRAFASVTSGSVYVSAMLNIASANATQDYFVHLGTSADGITMGSGFFCRVYSKEESGSLKLGIGKSAASQDAPVYANASIAYGSTVAIVVKYTFVSGDLNDTCSLYVFNDGETFPSSEPSPSAVNGTSTGGDSVNARHIAIRQGATTPAGKIAGIRVSTVWNDLVATASDRDELPEDYTLSSAYPNPFNPSTSFELTLAAAQQVRVSVYNALGQEVRNLHNGNLSAGTTQFNFNAAGLPSGLYFYRVQGANFAQTKSVTLLK